MTDNSPASIVRAAATHMLTLADQMSDESAAYDTNGNVREDYRHGRIRADWTVATNAAGTVLDAAVAA